MFPRPRYQLFPSQPAERRAALVESIRQRGIDTPTVWDEQGNILDGWERESVCRELRITCPREVRHFPSEAAKYRFVLAVNAHRLGQTLGVSKNTVASKSLFAGRWQHTPRCGRCPRLRHAPRQCGSALRPQAFFFTARAGRVTIVSA